MTPLPTRLRAIPPDTRVQLITDAGTRIVPVGRLAWEAADALERMAVEVEALREALKERNEP